MKDKLITASVFEIERYATKDGPGIRTVIFFKGCNLRCAWCQNPESQSFKKEVIFHHNLCKACGRCVEGCPAGAIEFDEKYGFISNPEICTGCGLCVESCIYNARALMGKTYTPQLLFEEIKKDIPFFDESNGGITVSGGEPMLHVEFLKQFFELCKDSGIHIAMETASNVSFEKFEAVMDNVDLFFCDIKQLDSTVHEFWTGAENQLILENIRKLSDAGKQIIIRIPVIPHVNQTLDDMQRIFDYIRRLNIERIELLAYHRLGLGKYRGLGRDYKLESVESLHQSDLDEYVALGKKMGLVIRAGSA